MATIDPYEQEVLAAFESGSLKSVATKAELAELRAAARDRAPAGRARAPAKKPLAKGRASKSGA